MRRKKKKPGKQLDLFPREWVPPKAGPIDFDEDRRKRLEKAKKQPTAVGTI